MASANGQRPRSAKRPASGKATARSDSTRNEINLFHEERFPHSIGLLYSAFTAYLGFHVNNGEYKVMGMAPYGEPRYVDKVQKLFQQNPRTAASA